jgi:hypothetical protein
MLAADGVVSVLTTPQEQLSQQQPSAVHAAMQEFLARFSLTAAVRLHSMAVVLNFGTTASLVVGVL